jgi:hypothetical protein
LIAYPGVEQAIGDIDHEIGKTDNYTYNKYTSLDNDKVFIEDGVNQQTSHPGDVENRFHED